MVDRGPWYRWAFERLGLEYRYEEQGRKTLQIPKGENNSIPPQAKRKKPHTGNNKPKTYSQYTIRLRGQGGEQKCLFGHYGSEKQKKWRKKT